MIPSLMIRSVDLLQFIGNKAKISNTRLQTPIIGILFQREIVQSPIIGILYQGVVVQSPIISILYQRVVVQSHIIGI